MTYQVRHARVLLAAPAIAQVVQDAIASGLPADATFKHFSLVEGGYQFVFEHDSFHLIDNWEPPTTLAVQFKTEEERERPASAALGMLGAQLDVMEAAGDRELHSIRTDVSNWLAQMYQTLRSIERLPGQDRGAFAQAVDRFRDQLDAMKDASHRDSIPTEVMNVLAQMYQTLRSIERSPDVPGSKKETSST